MPAVSWPSEASFSVCTRRSCAVRNSSSDCDNSRVRSCNSLEQSRVLDGDHGLVGEGRHQLDLLVGEWPDFLAIDCRGTPINFAFLQERNQDQAACAGCSGEVADQWIVVAIRGKVRHLNGLFAGGCLRRDTAHLSGGVPGRLATPQLGISRRRIVHGNDTKAVAFFKRQYAELRLADARGVLQHGVEYRLQIARRGADDTEHVRRRGLLLQGLRAIRKAAARSRWR